MPAMVDHEIQVDAAYSQFYFQDSEPRGNTGDPSFWTEEASARRLAVVDVIIGIGASTNGLIKVRVEEHDTEPELDLTQWDHVTECSLDIRSKFILVKGCLDQSGLFFKVVPCLLYTSRCV